jgi:hypothetical protein
MADRLATDELGRSGTGNHAMAQQQTQQPPDPPEVECSTPPGHIKLHSLKGQKKPLELVPRRFQIPYQVLG